MQTTCAHCGETFEMGEEHDCEPECRHCGATADEVEKDLDSDKIAVSRHERACGEREETGPIKDPEAEFRKKRREKKRQREAERRARKRKTLY